MITDLIVTLKQAGLELNAEEIADILWLANQMQQAAPQPGQTEQISEKSTPPLTSTSPISANTTPNQSSPSTPPQKEPTVPAYPSNLIPDSDVSEESSPTPERLPFKAPAVSALRNSLALARAIRPLMRKVKSRTKLVLDEERTARQIAEYQVYAPVLQPARERWLELVLVVEETSTTVVWEETIAEFQKLMERHGAFRNVYTWSLQTKIDGKPQIFPKKQRVTGRERSRSPKELLDATGRRLILLISDCISPVWWQGEIHRLLEIWGKHIPVAVLQLLPEQLWERTVLGLGNSVQLGTVAPGVLNSKLIVSGLPIWLEEKPKMALQFPVITLEPESLTEWAKVVAGAGSVQMLGVLFQQNWRQLIPELSTPQPPSNPELLVKRFYATASPLARRLAGFMASAPVSLPVINLIQHQLFLPEESRQIHLAEIFMSGLLQLVPGNQQTKTECWQYKFVDGVREILLRSVRITEIDHVLETLSQYIAEKIGLKIKNFAALLVLNPNWDSRTQQEVIPFAEVARQVLRQLGEDYADLVEQLDKESSIFSETSPAPSFEFQTCSFEVVTISVEDDDVNYNLQPFDFEVALITGINESNITPIEIADNLVFSQTEKHLTEVEKLIIQGTISNKTYKQIAASSNYSTQEIKDFADKLWVILSKALGEKITKTNFKNAIQEQVNNFHIELRHSRQTANYFIQELNGVQLEMVSIPEGSFMMGSPETESDRSKSESRQHRVNIQNFCMGKYTITQAQWQVVASLEQVSRELKPDPSKFKGANRPVEQVSWYDAVEFCQRLTAHTKREYRLPSEAEWEYACRAGTTSPFHFGETITSKLANYRATSIYARGVKGTYRQETTPVGSFKAANNFGLYDMHGNVLEWCLDDWHNNYEGAPTDGSAWFNNNNIFQKQGRAVLRGGSWFDDPQYCRSAFRNYGSLRDDLDNTIGFRVVCSVGKILQ
ncbi:MULTISPECIES: SAV_2336 N-terminal domain-related protein [Cyanophyceae]|uniref:SAV_2336 N-terminal domain-related protein n=1 Tax=Cyanophyceae TaxID=3028117 RepID=UPI0023309750|nr:MULTISPECIES: SAV_2336 N-terminal domain-related protein [Cyanophyceae]MDB9357037.1 SAV_2336 N-terminal domain-related protein [Nodularia spumigena CS-587/03]MDB9338683.1 SAV_2336 N-terminal domain-related protein [Nodularia spumigena CS-589/07]MDB9347622.1 SAV_2336 N-terminal domain-related protein [Nodularia spumigena CS-588/01]MDB9353798.1 SAV_2336 N-terminal domain-related protein [Nodularia spumigena CS-588/05]MDB9401843.1 SAV_2336 N-terminal domain-related protein [Microcystis aerugin